MSVSPDPRFRWIWWAIAVTVASALVVAMAVTVWAFSGNNSDIRQIQALQRQGLVIRSDICRSFEQTHKREVTQLQSTYKYLLTLSAEERKTNLNRTVAAQLPQAEKDARSDQDDNGVFVPKYCDLPGLGLPEPDPVIPERPAGLSPPRVPPPLP